ncbi:uncharacterized protein ISCGN_002046 [Ixodes scapularis]
MVNVVCPAESGPSVVAFPARLIDEDTRRPYGIGCALFASHYCFNICYAEGLSSTLEFLQRGFLSMNPDRGTRTKRSKSEVSKRVLNLVKKIAELEWNV